MATLTLNPTKIQYTLKLSDYSNWDSGDLSRVLVGDLKVQWHQPDTVTRGATRITYTWPADGAKSSRMTIYIPFASQSSPGRCAAYLTTKGLGIKNVVDSTDWIGPSEELNSDYIAKCANPYWDEACTKEVKNGTWYGEGSDNPKYYGVYFGFDLPSDMIAGATYYVYIIQEEGKTSNDCALYGTKMGAVATLHDYEPLSIGSVNIYTRNAFRAHTPYRWTNGSWKPVSPHIFTTNN